jgi:hypothetical protein
MSPAERRVRMAAIQQRTLGPSWSFVACFDVWERAIACMARSCRDGRTSSCGLGSCRLHLEKDWLTVRYCMAPGSFGSFATLEAARAALVAAGERS